METNIFITYCQFILITCLTLIGTSWGAPRHSYAPVFKKLYNGINQDVALPTSGVWNKVQHHPGHMQAIKEAGFESVRIFMPYGAGIADTERRIRDALDNGLAVVVCMWGLKSWSKGDIGKGISQISKKWKQRAQAWENLSNDVVFEILNEPEGIGFKDNQHAQVMKLYNAAIVAIREVDPDRPILVSPPGYNDADILDPWVTEEHLTYRLKDGTGFFDDKNIGVSIHFYKPGSAEGVNFAMWTAPLKGDWKSSIYREIMLAVEWRRKYKPSMPIIVTEWGCWLFDGRSKSDLAVWLDYHMDQFRMYNIGSMWYTGIQNNQRQFAIFNSELGWNQPVLDKLTGVVPASIPNTPQLLNGEFFRPDYCWHLSSVAITKDYVYGDEALNGISSLKLTVPSAVGGQLYQQTLTSSGNIKRPQAPGRTLIHLIQGQRYKMSFLARTDHGKGQIKIAMRDVADNSVLYDSYEKDGDWIKISTTPKTYTRHYTHELPNVMDVRFELDVGSKQQTLYLDKVELIRD